MKSIYAGLSTQTCVTIYLRTFTLAVACHRIIGLDITRCRLGPIWQLSDSWTWVCCDDPKCCGRWLA